MNQNENSLLFPKGSDIIHRQPFSDPPRNPIVSVRTMKTYSIRPMYLKKG
jgi:hypothetical protein